MIPGGNTPIADPINPPNVPLEDSYREREFQLREREIAAREREVSARERETKGSPWQNPLVIGVFAAALALIGNIFVTVSNNRNSQEVERIRAQSNLVFEAIKTNQVDACKNLDFFVQLGLLEDPHEAIHQSCTTNPTTAPSLPASGISTSLSGTEPLGQFYAPTSTIEGVVLDADTKEPISGATVTLTPLIPTSGLTQQQQLVMAETDKKGFFSIHLPSTFVGPMLRIEKDGYVPLQPLMPLTSSVYEMHKNK